MTRACVRNIIIYVLIKNLFALICNEFAYREEEEKMTLKDCYMQMGADYEETVQRLRSESLIQRIILKFPQDPSYQELCQALADGALEAIRFYVSFACSFAFEVAFRAAHTLKGVCQNLGFKNLYEPSAELTERLRPLQETETDDLMQKVTEEYNRTVKAIEDFQNA